MKRIALVVSAAFMALVAIFVGLGLTPVANAQGSEVRYELDVPGVYTWTGVLKPGEEFAITGVITKPRNITVTISALEGFTYRSDKERAGASTGKNQPFTAEFSWPEPFTSVAMLTVDGNQQANLTIVMYGPAKLTLIKRETPKPVVTTPSTTMKLSPTAIVQEIEAHSIQLEKNITKTVGIELGHLDKVGVEFITGSVTLRVLTGRAFGLEDQFVDVQEGNLFVATTYMGTGASGLLWQLKATSPGQKFYIEVVSDKNQIVKILVQRAKPAQPAAQAPQAAASNTPMTKGGYGDPSDPTWILGLLAAAAVIAMFALRRGALSTIKIRR